MPAEVAESTTHLVAAQDGAGQILQKYCPQRLFGP